MPPVVFGLVNDLDMQVSTMKLYITYTVEDLKDYAYQVGQVALDQGWEIIYGPEQGFEPARLDSLTDCDALVALSAYIYGSSQPGNATHEKEWDAARKLGKLTGALLVDTQRSRWPTNKIESFFHPDRLRSLDFFKKKLIEGGAVEYFNDAISSVGLPAQKLLKTLKKEVSTQAEITVFVVWDFTIRGLKHILARFQNSSPEGYRIEVPGLEGKGAAGEIFRDIVLPGIKRSDRVLVVTDRPNANVAFEAGLAIGFGKSISLVHFGADIPAWLQDSVFKGFVVRSIKDVEALRGLVKDLNSWYTPPRFVEVPAHGATLFLSPSNYVGAALKEEQGERYPFWKYPPDSFNLNDIHTEFMDVTQVVWAIAAYSDGTDVRDGLENAANGVISGWFYARACNIFADKAAKRLHVIRQEDARKVVDVEVIEMNPFADLGDFADRLNKVADFRLPAPLSLDVCGFSSIEYKMVKAPKSGYLYGRAVDQQLWIGIYTVTVRQYRDFCKATGHQEPEYWSKQSVDEDQPVVQVSYIDAKMFCEWTDLELPTEEQWRYYVRAGSSERYWWGKDDSLIPQAAWYKGNSDARPHPVGTKRPNTWGIYDVLGNVWEWTLKYTTYVTAPYGDKEATVQRAKVCGGAYNTELRDLDSSEEKPLEDKNLNIGFRCIKVQPVTDRKG